jgi:dTDP-D-glucose 4,6-dehydratase
MEKNENINSITGGAGFIGCNFVRYMLENSLNTDKIRSLGWKPRYNFVNVLGDTVRWYVENEWWWKQIGQITLEGGRVEKS